MEIEFLLNGETVCVSGEPSTRTLLDWLREKRSLTGTKEGCNEGDCGACTVMVSTLNSGEVTHQALNACILFLPQLHGKSVRTVEGMQGPAGELHPVQTALIEHHGSQCGFCTPGVVMSLAVAHTNGFQNHNDILAGNLCRCTGYAPIIKAAEAAASVAVPDWLQNDSAALKGMTTGRGSDEDAFLPQSVDELAAWYQQNPDATLVGGATDIGLWVTKKLAEPGRLCFIGQVPELQNINISADGICIGASVNMNRVQEVMADHHPDFAEMIRRYGSNQVRSAATIGGNIANGSPIGDGPPALIALGAILHLRKGDTRREMPLEDFFVGYGQQDISAGEFVEAVTIPRQPDNLKCYKISKRFDQDISAVCGCFSIALDQGAVASARIAFGGMAATPKRAFEVEKSLLGQPWNEETVRLAIDAFDADYSPIGDMRASAAYRMEVARNLLLRYFAENQLGKNYTRVQEVSA